MSQAARANRRGRDLVLVQPPPIHREYVGWHLIDTGMQDLAHMEWRPGVEVWYDEAGERVTAEAAGKLGWRYVREAG